MGLSRAKVAVAVSGAGRSLQNLISYSQKEDSLFEVSGVIASKKVCGAVSIARENNIPVYYDLSTAHVWLSELGIEWIVLAGFLKHFPLIESYEERVLNIHPSLLPKFGGKGMYGDNVHEAVFTSRDTRSGATIHFVSEVYDEGKIIAQGIIDIEHCHSPSEIAKSVFEVEKKILPRVLDGCINGEMPLSNGTIKVYEF